ncbi:hypothetical protein B0J12DRAFT_705512 [Macrophomina phaseolina]|uniref:Uncharacterized protein n=1 Tax=Macrophomina phaseolina TaxID=35725 RepID=A0ABQ8FRY0_9PEZI|nr:hypothetical protein B0J12DRAFT_705512 [Macrophomina phaseolina]
MEDDISDLLPPSRGCRYRLHYLTADNQSSTDCEPASNGSPASEAVDRHEQFQREHLANMVREILEAAIEGDTEVERCAEHLSRRIPDIIRACQGSLYEMYRRHTTTLGENHSNNTIQVDGAVPDMTQPNDTAAESTSGGNSTSLLSPFATPPETENGMTSNEAREVNLLSSSGDVQRSDSGYASNALNLQAECNLKLDHVGQQPNSKSAHIAGDCQPQSSISQVDDPPDMVNISDSLQNVDMWGNFDDAPLDQSRTPEIPFSELVFNSLITDSCNPTMDPNLIFDENSELFPSDSIPAGNRPL